MTIKPGDLVKYKSAPDRGGRRVADDQAAIKFGWTWQQCVDNLIGLVTKIEGEYVFVHWFCLNKTIWEWKGYLKVAE